MARRLILPGDVERMDKLTLFVPPGHEDDRPVRYRCTVQVGGGEQCGRPFFDGEGAVYERHVGECAKAHMAEIRSAGLAARVPVFDENQWDPEWAEHQRVVGERMIAEGRLVPHEHER